MQYCVSQRTRLGGKDTESHRFPIATSPFSINYDWFPSCPSLLRKVWRAIMETMLQGLVIIGGLTFSVATSLLIEELIFGRIVRLAFSRRPDATNQGQKD
jgi:hypothetical protein